MENILDTLKMAEDKDTENVLETNVDEAWNHKRVGIQTTAKENDDKSETSSSTDVSHDSAFFEKKDEIESLATSIYHQKKKEAQVNKEKEKFVYTRYFLKAKTEGAESHVIITGYPGSGKSAVAMKCAEDLTKNLKFDKEPTIVKYFTDYKGNQVVVIDEIFNQISTDIKVEEFISRIVQFAHNTSVFSRIIIVFQKEVLNLLRIQNPDHYFLKYFSVIDISGDELKLNDEERQSILEVNVKEQEGDLQGLKLGSQNFPSFPKCCKKLGFHPRKTMNEFKNISIGVIQSHFQSMTLVCKVILCGTAMKKGRLLHSDLQQTSRFAEFLKHMFEVLDEPFEIIPNQILNDITEAFTDVYLSYDKKEMSYEFINSVMSEAVHRMLFVKNKWRYIEECPVSRLCTLSSDSYYRSELKGALLNWLIERLAKELKYQCTENLLNVILNVVSWFDPDEESANQNACALVLELDWMTQKSFFDMMPQQKCKVFLSTMLLKMPCLQYNRLSRKWRLCTLQETIYDNLFDYNKLCPCLSELYKSYRSSNSFSRLHFLENLVEVVQLQKHSKICQGSFINESRNSIFANDVLPCGVRFSNCVKSADLQNMCIKEREQMTKALTKTSMCLLHSYTCKDKPEKYSDALIEIGEKKKEEWYIRCAIMFGSTKWRKKICSEILFQKNSFSTKVIDEEIRKLYIDCLSDKYSILRTFCGYRCVNEDNEKRGVDTIVLIVPDTEIAPLENMASDIAGLHVILRKENEVNGEAKDALFYETEKTRHPPLSSKSVRNLFHHHSNITLVNMSSVRSSGYVTSKLTIQRANCVVIHCQVKGIIPFGESPFPRFIEGYPVDVREATIKFALDPLRIGMEITNHNRTEAGTLGGFIDSTGTFSKLFLTCAHVVCPIETLMRGNSTLDVERQEVRVFDGRDRNENAPIGVVEKVSFQLDDPEKESVDAALVGVISRTPVDGIFAGVYKREQINLAGFSETSKPTFEHGKIESISDNNFRNDVIKVGAKTGLTIGSLKYENSCARLVHHDITLNNNSTHTLFNQYEISPRIDSSMTSDIKQLFIDKGDSGALVFIVKDNNPVVLNCIGMAVACTSYGSGIVTPVKSIFQAFQLPQNSFSEFEARFENQNDLSSILAEIRSGFTSVNQRFEKVDSDISSLKTSLGGQVEHISQRLASVEERLSNTESTDK